MPSDYQFNYTDNYTDKDPKLLTIEYHISLEIGLCVFSRFFSVSANWNL